MYYHMIIMFLDHRRKERIAYIESYKEVSQIGDFRNLYKELKSKYKNLEFTLHKLETDSIKVDSIPKYDCFFKGVKFYTKKNKNDFLGKLDKAIILTPVDLAKYILSRSSMTKLKLMKIVYFIYAKYGVATNEKLLQENVEAWQYGPVFPSLLNEFKAFGKETISLTEVDRCQLRGKRNLIEENKVLKEVINKILEVYRDKSGGDLVNETHKENTPWHNVYEAGRNNNISFDLTIRYYKDNL